jgi:hypothetical protein
VLAGLLAAAPAAADTASFSQAGCSQWSVPAGVSSVAIDAIGGGGARGGGSSGGQGGLGDEVTAAQSVTQGQSLDICVGVGGGAGASGSGGTGGGASGVSAGSDFSHPVVVAAGGGGGGASGSLAGGSGGAGGSSGSPAAGGASGGSVGGGGTTSGSGPGGGATGTGPGGGGGGAGYTGGGGGSGNSLGSGGGAGGTNYCTASGCATQVTTRSAQVILTYVVAQAPTASVSSPADGAVYALGQAVQSSFSCSEGAGGPGISSCTDQDGRPSGASVDTSTPGARTFTVTARSADGRSSSSSVSYKVAAPPVIWAPLPANGEIFTLGQAVHSWYLCADGTGGPGIKSCVDQNGQPYGAAVDTSTLGTHTFTVTATSQDGQTNSVTNTYRVVPVPTVSHVVAHRGGLVTLSVTTYAPGTIDVMNTAGLRSFALAADVAHPPNGSFVFGSAHAVSAQPTTLQLRVGLSQAGKLLLRDHRRATLRLSVVYTTRGGLPQLVKALTLTVRR